MTKRLATLLAAIVLGTTLLATGANAAVPTTDVVRVAAIPADFGQTVTEDDGPERDGIHHRRFCLRLNKVLSRSRGQQRHHARAEAQDHGSVQLRPAVNDTAGDDRPATRCHALTR